MGLTISPNASSPTGGSASYSWESGGKDNPVFASAGPLPDPVFNHYKDGQQITKNGPSLVPGADDDVQYTLINGQWVKGYWGKNANGQYVGTGQNPGDPWSKGNLYDPATAQTAQAGGSRAQPGDPGVPLASSWVPGATPATNANSKWNPTPSPVTSASEARLRALGLDYVPPNDGMSIAKDQITYLPPRVAGPPGTWGSTPVPTGGPGAPPTTAGSATADPSLAAAIQNSRNLQNQYNQPVTPLTAPTAQASLISGIERAQQQAAIQAGVATAGQSTAAQIRDTAMAREQAAIQAERVQAALAQRQGDISAERVDAAQADRTVLGPTELAADTQLAPTQLADQTVIDALKQEQFRQGQEGLVTGLNDAIAGKDPSVAAIMLRQATERNQANQFAMAQAASGGNVGFAQRQAMLNAADINQQSIGQQALLRAQEIATARGQLGSVLSQGRESDIGLATSQAQLKQEVLLKNAGFTNSASMTQAQLDQAVKLANAGFKNTATTTQAQLDQATATINVQQKNQVAITNANNALTAAKTNVELAQQVAITNATAENNARLDNAKNQLAAATKNAELAQAVALANQTATNNTNQTNAQLQNATGIANAGNQTQASVANANNQTSAATANKQYDTQVALANALAANRAAETNANNQTHVSETNAGNQVTTNSQNITAAQNAASNTLTASGQQVQGASAKATADAVAAKVAADREAMYIAALGKGAEAIIPGLVKGSGGSVSVGGGGTSGTGGGSTPDYGGPTNPGTPAPGVTYNDRGTPEGPGTQPTGEDTENGSPFGGDPSDRRVKKKVRRADAEISALLGSIKPYGFEYRDPKRLGVEGGKRFGLMAQDLEKSKAGRTLVNETPTGKRVNTNRAVLAALAALGSVDKRLKTIERKSA